jgi:hypothetical protein
MKASCLVFTIGCFGALTLALSFAGEPSDPPRDPMPSDRPREPALSENRAKLSVDHPANPGQQVQPRAGGERANGKRADARPEEDHASGQSGPTGRTKPADERHPGRRLTQPAQAKGEHPSATQNNNPETRLDLGNSANVSRPTLNTSAGAANARSTINKIEDHRSLPVVRPSSPALPNQVVARRGPGPASIGGTASASVRNTAVISGTMMKHRP